MDNCSAERSNTCTGETCTICEAKRPDAGCENNCSFSWATSTTPAMVENIVLKIKMVSYYEVELT